MKSGFTFDLPLQTKSLIFCPVKKLHEYRDENRLLKRELETEHPNPLTHV